MPGGGGKGGGGASSTVNVNNGPINVDSDSTVDINGLDDISVAAKIDPLDITSRQELTIPEPIRSESDITTKSDVTAKASLETDNKNAVAIDLEPVVLDVCSTTNTNLPKGEIVQPFESHFGFTWFGVEVFGFNVRSSSRTILRDLPKRPDIDWPAQENSAVRASPHRAHREPSAGRGGLRIRLKSER